MSQPQGPLPMPSTPRLADQLAALGVDLRPEVVAWDEVMVQDQVRMARGMVWAVVERKGNAFRLWRPDQPLPAWGRVNLAATVELVRRGETHLAADQFRAAGFVVGVLHDGPDPSWKSRKDEQQ